MDQKEERSEKILFAFLFHFEECVISIGLRTVYFHNLGRFDGICILRYYVDSGKKNKTVVEK